MLLKEQKWEDCPTCKRHGKIIQQEVYGCDVCKKEIDLNKKGAEYLDATVFHHDQEKAAEHMHFCSWRCVIRGLKKVKTDYFISLPFLHYGSGAKGLMAKDFFKFMKS